MRYEPKKNSCESLIGFFVQKSITIFARQKRKGGSNLQKTCKTQPNVWVGFFKNLVEFSWYF